MIHFDDGDGPREPSRRQVRLGFAVALVVGTVLDGDMTSTADDIDIYRQWRDEHSDAQLRHRAMASEMAWAWDGIDLLLREVARRIDPDEMDDDQAAIYEAGYVAGQKAVAERLRRIANEIDHSGG